MDFFEALTERVNSKGLEWLNAVDASLTNREFAGRMRDLTIEALREMMVGEPIKGKIWHCNEDDLEFTRFVDEEFDELIIAMDHIGTDGEEVAMIVLRCDKQKKQKG